MLFPSRARSAAQNEPVIQVCSHCGAVSNQDVNVCPFCEADFAAHSSEPIPVSASQREPEWRQEVARRLEAYRSRRPGSVLADETQSSLPFENRLPQPITTAVAPRTIARIRPTQRVEIHVSQPELDFSVVENYRLQPASPSAPMAKLGARQLAGLVDAIAIAGAFFGFVALFRSLGGQVVFSRIDSAVFAAALFLIFALYLGIFTLFSGATPGMQALGLSVVALDGGLPDTRQLVWRSLGCFLSAGALFLGYAWSLWDENHMCWHDRISRTYITSAEPVQQAEDAQEKE